MKKRRSMISRILATTLAITLAVPGGMPASTVQAAESEKNYEERLTPIMGWSSWNEFANVISEEIFLSNLDLMEKDGLIDLGYTYFNCDDGYQGGRDETTGLVVYNKDKFPHGMKYVVDKIHEKGMLAGIYTDIGKDTCASGADGEGDKIHYNKPGTGFGLGVGLEGHLEEDLDQYFKEWNYDFIKVDWCGGRNAGWSGDTRTQKYNACGDYIEQLRNELGKELIYNVCCWTFPGADVVNGNADSWRTGGDLWANWDSVLRAIDNYKGSAGYSKPGKSNDLDMMQIGRGLTYEEDKSHFTMWCMASSPLMIGADLRKISDEALSILKNEELIAIDQDEAVIGATVAKTLGTNVELWTKDLGKKDSPTKAIALLNRENIEQKVSFKWSDLGFSTDIQVRDLWQHKYLTNIDDTFTITLPAHGCAAFKVEDSAFPDESGKTVVSKPIVTQDKNTLSISTSIIRPEGGVTAKTLEVKILDNTGKEVQTEREDIQNGDRVTVGTTITLSDGFTGVAEIQVLDQDNKLVGEAFQYSLPLSDNGVIGYYTAHKLVEEGAILLDVRPAEDFEKTGIDGAVNIFLGDIDEKADDILPGKNAPIIVYCKTGKRSSQAREILISKGYTKVYDVGGYENYTIEPSITFTDYTGNVTEVILNNEKINVTAAGIENDNAEVKYSIGEESSAANAVSYPEGGFTLNGQKGDVTVKAYIFFENKAVKEASCKFTVFNDELPDLSKEKKIYCSSLTPIGYKTEVAESTLINDKSYNRGTMKMGGKTFDKGVSAHAPSTLTYQVPAGTTRFVAAAGCDDEVGSQAFSVLYNIYVDGQLMDRTVRMKTGRFYLFDIEVPEGAEEIQLVAKLGNASTHKNTNMHSEWGLACFIGDFEYYDDGESKEDPTKPAVPNDVKLLSQGKPVYATKTEDVPADKIQVPPENIVDGKLDTRWGSGNTDSLKAVQIDLGAAYDIYQIGISSYSNGRVYTYNVYVTKDAILDGQTMKGSPDPIAAGISNTGGGSNDAGGPVVKYDLPTIGSGQYVTIEMTTNSTNPGVCSIWEIEVYGKEPGGNGEENPALTNAKNTLQTAVNSARSIILVGQGGYSNETWESFKTAYAAAENALKENKITDADAYNTLKTALETAQANLDNPAVNTAKSDLQSVIDELKSIIDGGQKDYTTATWYAFTTAYNNALNAPEEASAATLTELKNALTTAQEKLMTPDDAKDALNDAITEAKRIYDKGQGDYTDASWHSFETAYEKAIAEKDSADADRLNDLAMELKAAQDGLEEKDPALKAAKEALNTAITAARSVYDQGQSNYTDASWKTFEDAYKAAGAAVNSANADELTKLAQALSAAQKDLKAKTVEIVETLQKGQLINDTKAGIQYKVTDANAKTVSVVKGLNKNAASIKIPSSITVDTISCNVTEIEKNAFKNFKKLKKVTIGKNVKTIGQKSFYNCKKLGTITFEGAANVTSIKSGAFKKTNAKMKVTLKGANAKKRKSMKNMLKKAGISAKAKMK